MDYAFAAAVLIAAALAGGHAVVYKRDPRSAAMWLIVILFLPAVGPIFYALLGVNRVRRRAARLRPERLRAPVIASQEGLAGTELAGVGARVAAGEAHRGGEAGLPGEHVFGAARVAVTAQSQRDRVAVTTEVAHERE